MKLVTLALSAVALMAATPATAQEMPLKPAEYVEISSIHIEDGHSLEYANHLANIWRKGQDFAVQQGWITGYEILANTYGREGEPDIYLLTRFVEWEDAAEGERRQKLYEQHMQSTQAQMQAASADRAKYRRQGSSMLLRRLVWRK